MSEVVWEGERMSSLFLSNPLLQQDGAILPRQMATFLQADDVVLHSIIEGEIFKEGEFIVDKGATGGAFTS